MSAPLPLSWFAQSFRGHGPHFAELLTLSIVLRLLALVSPFAMQVIIDRILPFERSESLDLILALLLATALFQAVISYASGRLGLWIGTSIGGVLSLRTIDHMLRLPLAFSNQWSVGELVARSGEISKVQAFLGYATTGLVLDAAFAVVYAAMLFLISPQLTVLLLLALPIQFGLHLFFGPLERRRYDKSFLASAAHQALLVDILSKPLALKAMAAERRAMDRIAATLGPALSMGLHAENLALMGRTVSGFLDTALVALVIYLGARLVLAHELTLGQLVSFHLLSGHVTGPVLGLASLWDDWQNVQVARRRVGDLLGEPAEPAGSSAPGHAKLQAAGRLEFDRVAFAYPDCRPVLEGLTATVPATGVTLITGPSGCGKSTLAKIAAGLLEPGKGEIRFNGMPLRGAQAILHRQRVRYVPQVPELFRGTIRDNLSLAFDIPDQEIVSALETVGLSHLGMDLDLAIGDGGAQLSGGQAQRLCFARGLLTGPSVLILDEPTSGLDAQASRHIAAAIAELSKSIAVVLITHNPELVAQPEALISFALGRSSEVSTNAA